MWDGHKMGLLQNISLLSAQPIKNTGGAAIQCVIRSSHNRPEQDMNMYVNPYMDKQSGHPNGYAPPYQIRMPMKDGGMSCYQAIYGTGLVNLTSLSLGKALATSNTTGAGTVSSAFLSALASILSDLSGLGSLNAVMVGKLDLVIDLIGDGNLDAALSELIWMTMDLAGSGDLASILTAQLNLTINLAGSGDIDATMQMLAWLGAAFLGYGEVVGIVVSKVEMASALLGNGDIEGALSLLIWLESAFSGSGELAGSLVNTVGLIVDLIGQGSLDAAIEALSNLHATIFSSGEVAGNFINTVALAVDCLSLNVTGLGTLDESNLRGESGLSATIKSYGDLTPEGIRDAIWNAVATSFENPGSMGEKLNYAGAGSGADLVRND